MTLVRRAARRMGERGRRRRAERTNDASVSERGKPVVDAAVAALKNLLICTLFFYH